MYERIYGAKYNRDLSTTEIAKLVRTDIKAAMKAGTLPKAKYSVRTEYYSGGSSLYVTISKVEEPRFFLYNPARLEHEVRTPHATLGPDAQMLYSSVATALLKNVEALVNAYNHNGSDIMVDYFDVKFYEHVTFGDWGLRDKELEDAKARIAERDAERAAG